MKLEFERVDLLAAMSAAAEVAPVRGVRPALKNALLRVFEDGRTELSATDMEVGLLYALPTFAAGKYTPCSIALPCQQIAALLDVCIEQVVTLEILDTYRAVLTVGRDHFEFLGGSEDDFPDVPALTKLEPSTLLAKDFGRVIELTAFACAREQGRYAINGLAVLQVNSILEVCGTDGRRLALAHHKLENRQVEALGDDVLILPLKLAQLIQRACDGSEDNAMIELAMQSRRMVCKVGAQTLSGLLIEGIYPKYSNVIPKDHDKQVIFKLESLLHGLRKAGYFVSEESNAVSFEFIGRDCRIAAKAAAKGQADVFIEVEYSGPDIAIQLNPKYLQEALKAMGGEHVTLELSAGNKPVSLRMGKDWVYVLMPVNAN